MTRGEENGSNGARLGGKVKGWQHWTTPKEVLDTVRELGPIALDPCSNEQSQVKATIEWNDGALTRSWVEAAASGLVFVNPPYNQARDFVKKCILESVAGAEIIALVASRTDTQWTKGCLQTAEALCFWEGRIFFENPPGFSTGEAPSIPSVLYYWGKRRWEFQVAFTKHGFCIDLRAARLRQASYAAGSLKVTP